MCLVCFLSCCFLSSSSVKTSHIFEGFLPSKVRGCSQIKQSTLVWKEQWLKNGLNGGNFQTQTGTTQQRGLVRQRLITSYLKESPKLLSCTLIIWGLQQQNWLKEFLVVSRHWTCAVVLFTYFRLRKFSGLANTTKHSAGLKDKVPRVQHCSHQKVCALPHHSAAQEALSGFSTTAISRCSCLLSFFNSNYTHRKHRRMR